MADTQHPTADDALSKTIFILVVVGTVAFIGSVLLFVVN